MKLTVRLLYALAMLHRLCAALPNAYVYTFDGSSKHQPPSEPPLVSTTAARLLFAQRLGLSQYHTIDRADENTIDLINRFGGTHDQIFNDSNERTADQKVLIFVENVERPQDLLDAESAKPAFMIDHPPSPSQNLQLALDLLNQDRHLGPKDRRICHVEFSKTKGRGLRGGINGRPDADELKGCGSQDMMFDLLEKLSPIETLEDMGNSELILGSTTIIHISMLEGLTRGDFYDRAVRSLKTLFRKVQLHKTSTTLVLLPPSSTSLKRLSMSPYGTYEVLPTVQRRAHALEEPLTAHAVRPPSSKHSHPALVQTLKTSVMHNGILPLCQPSKEKCIAATNNCSGHGTPYRKPVDPSANSAKECWSCQCKNTVRTDEDGKVIKTTQWGGPACQKNDVSVPFFLLAGFAIALAATVSWGIGLLYSIGQEDLPSVIGAGVTGPRAQK